MSDTNPIGGQADRDLAPAGCPIDIAFSKDAVTDLAREAGARLRGYVYRTLGNDADTDEVVNTAWYDVLCTWKRQGSLSEPRALLFRTAHRRAIDRLRTKTARREDFDQHALDAVVASIMRSTEFEDALITRLDVRAALAELPARQHEAMLRVYGYQLSYVDAAAIMGGATEDIVDNLLRAAKRNLRASPRLTGYRTPAPTPSEVRK